MKEMLDDRDGTIKQPHEPASTQRQTLPECPLFTLEITPRLRNEYTDPSLTDLRHRPRPPPL